MQIEQVQMSDQSDGWTREIEDLAKENSARVLSAVLGITRGEAADRILEKQPAHPWPLHSSGFNQMLIMAVILKRTVHTTSRVSSYRTGVLSGVQFTDKFPTVSRWLEDNPERLAILRSGSRFVYVGCGQVLLNTGPSVSYTRVTHVIFLDEEVGG